MDMKKYTSGLEVDMVKKGDVLKEGDWVLKWRPNEDPHRSGYELFTPHDFRQEEGQAPLGAVLLAAFFFLLENDSENFHRSIIDRANSLAREIENDPEAKPTVNHRTMN